METRAAASEAGHAERRLYAAQQGGGGGLQHERGYYGLDEDEAGERGGGYDGEYDNGGAQGGGGSARQDGGGYRDGRGALHDAEERGAAGGSGRGVGAPRRYDGAPHHRTGMGE